jgi:hypothetical protein
MRKLTMVLCSATVWLLAIPTVLASPDICPTPPGSKALDPANECNCPSLTGAGNGGVAPGPEAEPAYIGSGGNGFSRNQSLCLPQLAPVGPLPLAFVVQGVEPGIRVDSQGTIYIDSIRGVPGGGDLWRWNQRIDGAPNTDATIKKNDGTLPFKYEGQPDNCGILENGCANNVGSPGNPGVAPGGGDDDIAVNGPDPSHLDVFNVPIPNVAFVSLSAADVTAAHSTDRGDDFDIAALCSVLTGCLININPGAAHVPGDDRMWIDAYDDASTVFMNYHDLASGAIHVQLSTDGGQTYNAGMAAPPGAIDANTLNAAGGAGSGNVAGQIRIDKNTNRCSSRGNLYQIFSAPAPTTTPIVCAGTTASPCPSLRTVYVGVSTNAILSDAPQTTFTFTDHVIFTSTNGSLGAANGTGQVFPALATDNNGFVYAVWSDNSNIYFSSSIYPTLPPSTIPGSIWRTTPVQVNSGATTGGKANVFPWVAADANGHVVVVWLGANKVGNSNNVNDMNGAQWNVYAAETVNGNDPTPNFTQYTASDHVIHIGTVSTGGLQPGGTASRSLADFFQVALDPQHRANIAFADDHDTSNNHVGVPYFTRQRRANPSIVGTNGPSSCFHTVSQVCSGGGGGDDAEGDGDEEGSDGHRGQFAFKTPDSCHPSGEMDFDESDTGEHMKGNRMDSVSVSGNQATISGAGTLADGTAVNYTAVVLGNMPVIGANNFAISWITATGSVFHTSGPLTGGYILVHTL